MKRIINACLEQTLHFSLKEQISPEEDRRAVRQEFEHYQYQMQKKRMQYEILSEEEQADGSLIVRLKRQYNNYPCEEYLK